MKRSMKALATVASAILVGGVLTSAPASASPSDIQPMVSYEWNTAEAGSPPSGIPCVSTTGAIACFQANGDKWWVKDTSSDSASAVANWVNYRNGSLYRKGGCRNGLGSGKWGVCNKNYYEDSTLAFNACVYDASEGVWVRCS
ncbi:hypothetical protein [Micromonospora polyrhachis]|uniref:Secreted protein n=1 Tax=Micromonospora polyrhachis TaxID=1282883 RepID=A0A7W7SSM4_9ACTN|nr:hypothetical protein [Micromonospora polyrhachis]MBB4959607.1 hypothetical protein [Micromonospora polyrhachis]